MSPRHILLALAITTVWGVSFVAIRWGVDEVAPLLLTALRYLFAAIPAVFFIRRPKVDWWVLVAYGLAIGVGQFGLLFIAIKLGMPAGLSSLVVQLQVFFTIFLAVLFFGERPGLAQVMAALLPLLLTIIAAVCWGLGNSASKKAGRIEVLPFIVWSSLIPPIPLFLASLLLEGPGAIAAATEHLTWRGVGSVAFMSYAATLFGFGLWALLLSRYPANVVAPFALFVPVAGIGSAALLLGETISQVEIAGSVLVFVGLLVNVFGLRLLARRPA